MKNLFALAFAGLSFCTLPALAENPRPVFAAVSQGVNVGVDGAGATFRFGQNINLGAVILGLQTEVASDFTQSARSPCILTDNMCSAQFSAGVGLSGRLGVMVTDHTMVYVGAGLRQARVMAATPLRDCGRDPCYLSADQRGWDIDAGVTFATGAQWQMQANYHYGKRHNAHDGSPLVTDQQESKSLSISMTARF